MSPRGPRLTWKVIRGSSERPPRTSEEFPIDLEGHLRDPRGLNFITELLTFYILSHPFVVKTARRARLTFYKLTSPIDLEGHPRDIRETSESHPRTSERLNFITEFLTFYILSRPFVVKTARRARLTFSKYIYH